jgi:hypothetical protein
MTSTTHAVVPSATKARAPWQAVTAGALGILLGLFGGYGAIYFTGLEGWDDFAITYVTTYEAVALLAVVSGAALIRGSDHARVGLIAYCLFQVAFTAMKIVTIQEWEALTFGVLSAITLALVLHPRVTAWTRR